MVYRSTKLYLLSYYRSQWTTLRSCKTGYLNWTWCMNQESLSAQHWCSFHQILSWLLTQRSSRMKSVPVEPRCHVGYNRWMNVLGPCLSRRRKKYTKAVWKYCNIKMLQVIFYSSNLDLQENLRKSTTFILGRKQKIKKPKKENQALKKPTAIAMVSRAFAVISIFLIKFPNELEIAVPLPHKSSLTS